MSERNFINMDSEMVADSLQWWVDYHENDEDKRDYFDTEGEALTFYHTFPKGTPRNQNTLYSSSLLSSSPRARP